MFFCIEGHEWMGGTWARAHAHDIVTLDCTENQIFAGSHDSRVSINCTQTLQRSHYLNPLTILQNQIINKSVVF